MEQNDYNSVLHYLKHGTYIDGIVDKGDKRKVRQKAQEYTVIMDKLHKVVHSIVLLHIYNPFLTN